MSIQLRSSVQQYAPPDPPGLLDLYPSDTAAGFSYRRLRRDAELCCRVKRLSDNVQMDFGFVYNADLNEFIVDIASILGFLGGATGSISRWYDQNFHPTLRYLNYSATPDGVNLNFDGFLELGEASGVGTKRLVVSGAPQQTAAGRIGHLTSAAIGNSSWVNGPERIAAGQGYLSSFCVAEPAYSSEKRYTLLRMHPSAPTTNRPGYANIVYHSAPTNVWGSFIEAHRTVTTNATASQLYATPIPRGGYTSLQVNSWIDFNATLPEYTGVAMRGIDLCGSTEKTYTFQGTAGPSMHLGFQPGGYGWDSSPFHGIYNECVFYNTNEQHANRVAISLNQMAYYGITPFVVP